MTGKFSVGDREYFKEATLYGGSWETTLPLTNMQRRPTSLRARSTDTTLASTWFVADLQASRNLQHYAFVDHNFSNTAQMEIIPTDIAPIAVATAELEYADPNGTLTITGATLPEIPPGTAFFIYHCDDNTGLPFVVESNTSDTIVIDEATTGFISDESMGPVVLVFATGLELVFGPLGETVYAPEPERFDAIPAVYDWLENDFYNPNWFDGKPSTEDYVRLRRQTIYIPEEASQARYVFVQIYDENNPDEYVENGFCFFSDLKKPGVGIRTNDEMGIEDESPVEVTKSRVEYFDEDDFVPRTVRVEIRGISKNEAFGKWYDMGRRKGKTRPLFIIPEPDDTLNQFHEAYLCRFAQPPVVTCIETNVYMVTMTFKEFF